jgi:hypothetical protein
VSEVRVGDTLRFKRDIVDATTKHRALFAAMIGSRFTERSGCDGQPYVTPLERESITNATFNLGLPALADSEVFYVGNNVVEEYKNRALGPDPRQLGTVHPYAKSGLVVFEQPLNINPNDLFHDYEPGEIETSIDPVTTIVPINALSWAVGNIPATDPQGLARGVSESQRQRTQ